MADEQLKKFLYGRGYYYPADNELEHIKKAVLQDNNLIGVDELKAWINDNSDNDETQAGYHIQYVHVEELINYLDNNTH